MGDAIRKKQNIEKGALSLRLSVGESVFIGADIEVKVTQVRGQHNIRLAFMAPKDLKILRSELKEFADV